MKYLISSTFLLLILTAIFFSQVSYGLPKKNDPNSVEPNTVEFINGQQAVRGQVFVRFKDTASRQLISKTFSKLEVIKQSRFPSTGTYLITSSNLTTSDLIGILSKDPAVDFVSPNYLIKTNAIPSDEHFSNQWYLRNTGQEIAGQTGTIGVDVRTMPAWNITKGSASIAVGILDSGTWYLHNDLANNIWSAPTAYTVQIDGEEVTCNAGTHGINIQSKVCVPIDDSSNSHGTRSAGIIGARGDNEIGIAGINWKTNIISVKILDNNGSGDDADARWGIEYALQLKQIFGSEANIRVLNNSYGRHGNPNPEIELAIQILNLEDVLFVAAAGNDGTDNDQLPVYPAGYNVPNVISVASIDNDGLMDPLSNYGIQRVHLGAPGVNIFSAVALGGYDYASGTSFAAPQVSGAALLILSRCDVDTQNLKSLILENTDPTQSLIGKTVTGGRLNVYKALANCSPEPLPSWYSVRVFPSNVIGVADINNSGRVLGIAVIPNTQEIRSFLYDGVFGLNLLPPHPTTNENPFPTALNRHEWATGNFLYTPPNGMQLIGSLPGYGDSFGRGINDAGQIVGDIFKEDFGYTPFLRNPNGQFDFFEPYGETTGQAVDINNNGQITGIADPGWMRRGFIFDLNTRTTTDIPVPAGFDPSSIEVKAINDNGTVIGTIFRENTTEAVAFMYSIAQGLTFASPDSLQSELLDINNAGQAVGYTYGGPGQTRAIIYDRVNGLRYLDTMLSHGDNKTPTRAYNINNNGQITLQFGWPCIPFCIPEFPLEEAMLNPSLSTDAGSNIAVQSGSVRVTYSNITVAGETLIEPMPLPPSSALPDGYLLTESSVAYNVGTNASFSGSNEVCFNLTSIANQSSFNRMKLLHYEDGSYVNRTVSYDYSILEVCAAVNTFSPFVIAQAPIGPTAATVAISGKATSDQGQGLANARIDLIDSDGNVKTALTGPFGYFHFDDITVGSTYVLSVSAKNYLFENPTQIISVGDEILNIRFVGHLNSSLR